MRHLPTVLLLFLSGLPACSATASPADAAASGDAAPGSDAGLADAAITADAALAADAAVVEDAAVGPVDAAACPVGDGTPSAQLLTLHETLIRPGCVGAGRFCHEGMTGFGFGMLTPEVTLENLVNVTGCMGVRVVPCSTEESYVSTVVRTGGEPCARPFPTGPSHPTFSDPEIAAIEDWIRAGAH
jgi:hypothetical protein